MVRTHVRFRCQKLAEFGGSYSSQGWKREEEKEKEKNEFAGNNRNGVVGLIGLLGVERKTPTFFFSYLLSENLKI